LSQLQVKHKAKAIITAHHQDDLIETALINVIRGTGRLGLSAIANNKQILRPLIGIPKQELLAYTQKHKLQWREDSTNQDTDYLRNYLRINILAGLTVQQRQKLISNLDKVAIINIEIDSKLATLSQYIGATDIDRNLFSGLPSELGNEVVAHHLRRASVSNFDSKTVGRLSMAIKTSKPSSTHPVKQNSYLRVGTKTASIVTP
jgi:tRNA(Ile)-lysidine synthase TilS/MesJ